MKRYVFSILVVLILAVSVHADDELQLTGYVELDYSARITNDDDYIIAEERLQLEFAKESYDPLSASFFAKVEFIKDELSDETNGDDSTDIDVREAYMTLAFDSVDFKIGRQITTWGVSDLLFINDIFPKDWTSLLAGRPLQYLKIGTSSVKMGLYSDIVNADLIVTPFFEEDVLPDGDRLQYYAPQMPAGITSTRKTLPKKDVSNSEVSLKLSKYAADTDVSLYYHRTFWKSPHMRFIGTVAEIYYPDLNVYGASLTRPLFGGIAKFEAGYYHSRHDETGTDPLIKNSEYRYLIGFDKELFTEFNVGLQFYSELMTDYQEYVDNLPAGEPKRDNARRVLSVRLTKFMLYQTLRLSLYSQFSPTDDDYYVNPEVKYNITDNLYAALGTNIFDGTKEHTMFGQYDNNDNLYTQLRYNF